MKSKFLKPETEIHLQKTLDFRMGTWGFQKLTESTLNSLAQATTIDREQRTSLKSAASSFVIRFFFIVAGILIVQLVFIKVK